jgi:hypothetical protein
LILAMEFQPKPFVDGSEACDQLLSSVCWAKTCGRKWWRWLDHFYNFWEYLILAMFIICWH